MMIVSPLGNVPMESESELWSESLRSQSKEILEVPERLMVQLFGLGRFFSTHNYDANALLRVRGISSMIDEIWSEYLEDAVLRSKALQDSTTGETVYRDATTALNMTYFAAAQMLLSSLTQHLISADSAQVIEDHAQVIINCTKFLHQSRKFIGCASFALFLPLTLVALCSPSPRQKRIASAYLNNQFRGTPFMGLRSIAVRRINSVGLCLMEQVKVLV